MSHENDRANADAEALSSPADTRSENDGSSAHFFRALTCCSSINEATAEFVAAATGSSAGALPWGETVQRLVDSGRFVPTEQGALEVVPTMVVDPGTDAADEASSRREIAMLLDHWCDHPEPDLLTEAVLWATQIEAWGQLQRLWSEYLCTEDLAHRPQAAHAMALIPEQVRRHSPLLTAATGASRAVDLSGSVRGDAMIDFAARDAMDLHSRWESLEDTDAATLAGTLWMICQRYVPQGTPEREVDSSWDTRNEIITFLDQRRHENRPASAWALAFFRAASAQLAFIRADLITSFTDSGIVEVVDDGIHFRDLLSGTRRLTLALTDSDPGAVVETELHDAMTPGTWQGEIREEAVVTSWLADALLRLRRLESSGPGGWLETVPESSRNSPLWTAFAWTEATAEGLWCDPSEALAHLDDRIGEHLVLLSSHDLKPPREMPRDASSSELHQALHHRIHQIAVRWATPRVC